MKIYIGKLIDGKTIKYVDEIVVELDEDKVSPVNKTIKEKDDTGDIWGGGSGKISDRITVFTPIKQVQLIIKAELNIDVNNQLLIVVNFTDEKIYDIPWRYEDFKNSGISHNKAILPYDYFYESKIGFDLVVLTKKDYDKFSVGDIDVLFPFNYTYPPDELFNRIKNRKFFISTIDKMEREMGIRWSAGIDETISAIEYDSITYDVNMEPVGVSMENFIKVDIEYLFNSIKITKDVPFMMINSPYFGEMKESVSQNF